ncbi:MAG: tol-pal system protein YbgF [Proteobacteria bacterium]|nr:tol-pal system protein YbgF [Pseudomonadota bacterium]
MLKRTTYAILLACLSTSIAWAAPGDYDPAYEQGGGYGAVTLDERVAKLEKKLSGDGQIELLNRVEQLQGDVLRLRGDIEELAHHLEAAKKQNKEQLVDFDRRIQALTPTAGQPATPEEAPASEQDPNAQPPANPLPTQQAPAPSPTPIVTPTPVPTQTQAPAALTQAVPALATARPPEPPKQPAPTYAVQTRTPPPVAPSPDSEARQAAYQKGFNLMKDGKYAEAIKELKNFLAAYPKGEYSDNAAYWLAEAHYVNRDLAAARESFRKLVKDYPQAAKVSDAQLKLGYIDFDTGQWAAARESLGEVIKRYPDSSAAKLAQKRLDKIKQEGH